MRVRDIVKSSELSFGVVNAKAYLQTPHSGVVKYSFSRAYLSHAAPLSCAAEALHSEKVGCVISPQEILIL